MKLDKFAEGRFYHIEELCSESFPYNKIVWIRPKGVYYTGKTLLAAPQASP